MGISIIESVRWVSRERRHPQSFQRWQPAGARCVGKGELFIIFGHFQQFWLAEVMFIFFLSISVFHSPGVLCVEQLLADWHRDTMDTNPNRVNKGNWHNEVSDYSRTPSATPANIECRRFICFQFSISIVIYNTVTITAGQKPSTALYKTFPSFTPK